MPRHIVCLSLDFDTLGEGAVLMTMEEAALEAKTRLML